ncbi:MarR family transcriptional regulator [Liquorilactobacillus capillatus]|uniref:HTH marR-type domain-containing protein n=1 Tax=Liquorilactobacillus capillatus DSM 19910 TaxID=1423731 RepID=A0A0R1M309_9LACO|nr:MarR family transcriptional regulator [Liquorilactobacillus capillatus]KRL02406.1 hypothetical protein FC81_GL000750 [Liquorilactobacillus capillatus DSM 19910]
MSNLKEQQKAHNKVLTNLRKLFQLEESLKNKQNNFIGDGKVEFNNLVKKISLKQLELLYLISVTTNSTNTQLAKYSNTSKPAITRLTKKLLEQQFTDVHYLADNKSKNYTLTNRGLTILSTYKKLHQQASIGYQKVLSVFSVDELGTINLFIERLITSLQQKDLPSKQHKS